VTCGGGGPGLEISPERVVVSRFYAQTRNLKYLGRINLIIGLTMKVQAWIAAWITFGTAILFHTRVVGLKRN